MAGSIASARMLKRSKCLLRHIGAKPTMPLSLPTNHPDRAPHIHRRPPNPPPCPLFDNHTRRHHLLGWRIPSTARATPNPRTTPAATSAGVCPSVSRSGLDDGATRTPPSSLASRALLARSSCSVRLRTCGADTNRRRSLVNQHSENRIAASTSVLMKCKRTSAVFPACSLTPLAS